MPLPTRSTVRFLRSFRTPEGWTVEAGTEGSVIGASDGDLELRVASGVVLVSVVEVELTWRPDPPLEGARVRGCLLGGAVGDACGAPFEGGTPSPESSRLATTDDTQLTLATCAAIADAGRVDPAAIAEAFATEFRASRLRGLGASTYKALSELALVRLGGDADTLCSLTGQLVGACLGPEAVPDPLLRRLDDRLHVESVATHFAAFLG